MLVGVAGLVWMAYTGITTRSMPPAYAWVVTIGSLVVSSVVKNLRLYALPCPRCNAKPLRRSVDDRHIFLTCERCMVRWNTREGRRDAEV
jgi:hypothetical protein